MGSYGARAALSGAVCGLMLAGCAAVCDDYQENVSRAHRQSRAVFFKLREADEALLAPPAKPECEAKAAQGGAQAAAEAADGVPAKEDANAALALRIKLEYERECYRQAESRVRRQLQALQQAARESSKALNGSE